jgi:hypothetical protein
MADAADRRGRLPIPVTAPAGTNGIRIGRARFVVEAIGVSLAVIGLSALVCMEIKPSEHRYNSTGLAAASNNTRYSVRQR